MASGQAGVGARVIAGWVCLVVGKGGPVSESPTGPQGAPLAHTQVLWLIWSMFDPYCWAKD